MRFSDLTFKVGISADPLKRLNRLKEHPEFNKNLEGLEYFKTGSKSASLSIEREILKSYGKFKHEGEGKFNGYSEFLVMGDHYQEISDLLKSTSYNSVNYYFNPFIVLNVSIEALPIELRVLVRSKFKSNYFTREGRRAIKLFLGNLVYFKGNRFICPQPKRVGCWMQKLNTLNGNLTDEDLKVIYGCLSTKLKPYKFTKQNFTNVSTLYERYYLHFGMGFPWLEAAIGNCPDIKYKTLLENYLDTVTKEK